MFLLLFHSQGKTQIFKHVAEIVRFQRSICIALKIIKTVKITTVVKSLDNCNRNC